MAEREVLYSVENFDLSMRHVLGRINEGLVEAEKIDATFGIVLLLKVPGDCVGAVEDAARKYGVEIVRVKEEAE